MALKPMRKVSTQKKTRIPCCNFEKEQNNLRGGLGMLKGLPSSFIGIALHEC